MVVGSVVGVVVGSVVGVVVGVLVGVVVGVLVGVLISSHEDVSLLYICPSGQVILVLFDSQDEVSRLKTWPISQNFSHFRVCSSKTSFGWHWGSSLTTNDINNKNSNNSFILYIWY